MVSSVITRGGADDGYRSVTALAFADALYDLDDAQIVFETDDRRRRPGRLRKTQTRLNSTCLPT